MSSVEPTTEAEFTAALQSLLLNAHENQVNIEGGWDCRNGGGHPDWDILITEVEKKSVSTSD